MRTLRRILKRFALAAPIAALFVPAWSAPAATGNFPADAATSPTAARAAAAPRTLGPWLDPDTSEPAGTKYCVFFSKAAGQIVSYQLYLPPDYDTAVDKRYPVIYWLHGSGNDQRALQQTVEALDPAIRAGKAPAMILVGANGRTYSSWVDAYDGSSPVQSMFVDDLIPYIDATYRTIPTREARAIEGYSMGGAGVAKIAFKHPELFGVVSILAAALQDLESTRGRGDTFQTLYGGSEEYFLANYPWTLLEKNADAIRGRTLMRLAVGSEDNLLAVNQKLSDRLTALNIAHDFYIIPGIPHRRVDATRALGDRTVAFYNQAFGGLEQR